MSALTVPIKFGVLMESVEFSNNVWMIQLATKTHLMDYVGKVNLIWLSVSRVC